jgi:hypothetical protein
MASSPDAHLQLTEKVLSMEQSLQNFGRERAYQAVKAARGDLDVVDFIASTSTHPRTQEFIGPILDEIYRHNLTPQEIKNAILLGKGRAVMVLHILKSNETETLHQLLAHPPVQD